MHNENNTGKTIPKRRHIRENYYCHQFTGLLHLDGFKSCSYAGTKKKHHPDGWCPFLLVDDNGLEPLTLRTSSACSTS